MKTILVTGGAGFIGSHTCISLLEKNYRVVVIDSYTNSSQLNLDVIGKLLDNKYSDLIDRFFIFNGDIRDEKFLLEIFDK